MGKSVNVNGTEYEFMDEKVNDVDADEIRIPVRASKRSAFRPAGIRKKVALHAKREYGFSNPAISPRAGGGVQPLEGGGYENIYVVTDG